MRSWIVVALVFLLSAAAGAQPAVGRGRTEADPRFHATLRDAAASYRSWGRIDLVPAWAPELCFQPPPLVIEGRAPRVSDAEQGAHGRKLYFLYARDRARYPMRGAVPATPEPAIGQVIVKESFVPREVAAGTEGAVRDREGRHYLAGDPSGLFVMARVADERDPRTDAGWIYGTIDRDGRITSSGRVASCMGCHASVPGGGRLFGLSPRLDRHEGRVEGPVVIPGAASE